MKVLPPHNNNNNENDNDNDNNIHYFSWQGLIELGLLLWYGGGHYVIFH